MKKIAVVCLFLCLTMLFCACGKGEETTATTRIRGEMFDYPSLDLSRYASISRADWENITVSLNAADYLVSDEDVTDYLHILQEKYLSDCPTVNKITDRAVVRGDTVYIFYTGYDENGIAFEGGSNMATETASPLKIGSGAFIPGFEEGLIGVIPSSTSFVKNTTGNVEADDTVYYAYTCTYCDDDGTELSKKTFSSQRIPLTSPAASYGAGFVQNLTGKTIAETHSFTLTEDFDGDGKNETKLYEGKVLFSFDGHCTTVQATFPENYREMDLAGKTVFFDVVISYIEDKIYPELTENFVIETAGYTPTTDDPVTEFLALIRSFLEQQKETEKQTDLETGIVDTWCEKVSMIAYPKGSVAYYYDYNYKQIEESYNYYAAYYEYYNMEFPFASLNEYIVYNYGLAADADGLAYLTESAQKLVRENLSVFLIGRELGYTVSDEEITAQAGQLAEQYNAQGNQTSTQTADTVIEAHGTVYLECCVMYSKVIEYCLNHVSIDWK